MSEKLKPTNDLMFKKTFASECNKTIIKGFVKDYFGIEAETITVKNPYSIEAYKKMEDEKEETELRETRADITYEAEDSALTVEIQVKKTDFYDRRALYYACDAYRAAYNDPKRLTAYADGKVNRYESLRPLYALNILAYNHFKEDSDALHKFELYDRKHGIILTDEKTGKELFAVTFFESGKLAVENENQKYWQMYFNGQPVPEEAPEYIKEAAKLLDIANLNEEEREMYESCEQRTADNDAYICTAWNDGEAVGEARGRSSERIKIACALMKKLGLPLSSVLTVMPDATESELSEIRKMSEN
jgi:predicted transposase/invertase (TIGR01784 family)